MPEPTDVMKTSPFYQLQQQDEISRFLKIQPLALGVLEILVAFLGLSLTIWKNYFLVIWSPIAFIIIGAITVLAAHTRTPRLVKSSQMLSYVSFAVVSFSIRGHLFYALDTPDVSSYILIVCDILIFIISLAVAITSCSCCCKPVSPHAMASYEHVSSVMYVLPETTPPPDYSLVPSTAPPTYEHEDFQTRR